MEGDLVVNPANLSDKDIQEIPGLEEAVHYVEQAAGVVPPSPPASAGKPPVAPQTPSGEPVAPGPTPPFGTAAHERYRASKAQQQVLEENAQLKREIAEIKGLLTKKPEAAPVEDPEPKDTTDPEFSTKWAAWFQRDQKRTIQNEIKPVVDFVKEQKERIDAQGKQEAQLQESEQAINGLLNEIGYAEQLYAKTNPDHYSGYNAHVSFYIKALENSFLNAGHDPNEVPFLISQTMASTAAQAIRMRRNPATYIHGLALGMISNFQQMTGQQIDFSRFNNNGEEVQPATPAAREVTEIKKATSSSVAGSARGRRSAPSGNGIILNAGQMKEAAQQRSREKGIPMTVALSQIQKEQTELISRTHGM